MVVLSKGGHIKENMGGIHKSDLKQSVVTRDMAENGLAGKLKLLKNSTDARM